MTTRNYTRFIPGEEISDVAEWRFGAVDTASLLALEKARAMKEAPAQVVDEAYRQAVYHEGYEEGFEQGLAQATLDGQKKFNDYVSGQGQQAAQEFSQLFESASAGLDQIDQSVAQGLLELVCELARQVVRQELSVNPDVLRPVVREALGILVADSKSAVIKLHPLDVSTLQESLRDEFASLNLTWVADDRVDRGGCLIESAGAVIDGQLDKRWSRAVANLGLSVNWKEPDDVE